MAELAEAEEDAQFSVSQAQSSKVAAGFENQTDIKVTRKNSKYHSPNIPSC